MVPRVQNFFVKSIFFLLGASPALAAPKAVPIDAEKYVHDIVGFFGMDQNEKYQKRTFDVQGGTATVLYSELEGDQDRLRITLELGEKKASFAVLTSNLKSLGGAEIDYGWSSDREQAKTWSHQTSMINPFGAYFVQQSLTLNSAFVDGFGVVPQKIVIENKDEEGTGRLEAVFGSKFRRGVNDPRPIEASDYVESLRDFLFPGARPGTPTTRVLDLIADGNGHSGEAAIKYQVTGNQKALNVWASTRAAKISFVVMTDEDFVTRKLEEDAGASSRNPSWAWDHISRWVGQGTPKFTHKRLEISYIFINQRKVPTDLRIIYNDSGIADSNGKFSGRYLDEDKVFKAKINPFVLRTDTY